MGKWINTPIDSLNSITDFQFQNPEILSSMKFFDPSSGFDFIDPPPPPPLPPPPPHHHPFLPLDLKPSNSYTYSNSNSDSAPSSILSLEGDNPLDDDTDFSDSILKYVNQMLMEEEEEEAYIGHLPSISPDPIALQAAEKSLYDVIGEQYPIPSAQQQCPLNLEQNYESPDDQFSTIFSDYSSTYSSSVHSSVDSQVSYSSRVEFQPRISILQSPPPPADFIFQSAPISNLQSPISFSSFSELKLQFKRGMDEARKFLPGGNQLVNDLERKLPPPPGLSKNALDLLLVQGERDHDRDYFPIGSRGRKSHEREEDADLEEYERSSKQSAVLIDESELSDMFDKLLHCGGGKDEPSSARKQTEQENENPKKFNPGLNHVNKQVNSKKEVIDLQNLLILCAQAVSAGDSRTANELLKQIRLHSSPFGDGTLRVAHCLANSLEARLTGNGNKIYSALSSKRRSASDMLKAYNVFVSACPFKRFSVIFANHMILSLAQKAKTVHIIDFGILYGFQWPVFIRRLSERPGGPPKLRISGIDHPVPGFRPMELILATGRRLAKHCERLKVPFEYNCIASKNWETIRVEDLKLSKDEVVVVNSIFRFKNLLDETIVINSPKNAVLKLIREINPSIFIHSVVNGSYSSPFFMTRFREVLFHLSTMFDMLEANVPREDPMRMMFEKEFLEKEAVNVIACEGLERVERPETYKQWQVRTIRAGFKQIPLGQEIMKKLRGKVKSGYHSNFMVDEDGHWMLQGWKGRIVCASSYWVPA